MPDVGLVACETSSAVGSRSISRPHPSCGGVLVYFVKLRCQSSECNFAGSRHQAELAGSQQLALGPACVILETDTSRQYLEQSIQIEEMTKVLTLDLVISAFFNPLLASRLILVCGSSPACLGPGLEKFRALELKVGGGPVLDPIEYDRSEILGLGPNADCSADRLRRFEWLPLRLGLGAGCSPG